MIVWRTNSSPSFNLPALFSTLIFEWKVQWNPTYFSKSSTRSKRRRRHTYKRYLLFAFGVVLFSTIFASTIYHNLQVNIKGQPMKVRDLFQSHEFSSLAREIWNLLRKLWAFYWQYGLKGIWSEIRLIIHSDNEKQAYEVRVAHDLRSRIFP